MKKLFYIARYTALAVLLLLLFALAPVKAQNVVYQGETTVVEINPQPGDTYDWQLYNDSTLNFAATPGETSASYAEIVGSTTSPDATILWKVPGTYFYKVTAVNAPGCSDNLQIGKIKVLESLPTAKMTINPICIGEPAKISIEFTGTAPWSFTYTDGTSTWTVTGVMTNIYELIIDPGPKKTTDYQIISITDKWGTNNVPTGNETQQVNPKPNSSPIYLHKP